MIVAIAKLRIGQARRILNDLGLGRVIFVVFMLAGLSYQLFIAMKDKPNIAVPVWLMVILLLHLKRKDLRFLKSHVEGYRWVMAGEYLILSLPVLAGLIVYRHILELAGFFAALGLLVRIGRQFRKFTLNTFIQEWLPDECFEWKSGVRQYLLYMVPLWLIGLGGSFWPGTVPVVMLALGMFITGFTQKNEPLQLLLVFERNAKKLLWFKISRNLMLLTAVLLPLMTVYFIIHPQYWYIPVAFYLILIITVTYAVLCKYAFYRPDIATGNQVFTALGPASIFVSFLMPLIIILSVRFYFKSIQNLKQYLYDFH